jgi:tetratricopeptide (TPR) repeat protein
LSSRRAKALRRQSFMKRSVAFIGILSLALAACGGGAVEPANVANTEANTAPVIAANSEYTDANVALSEGKRLMDENQTDQAIAALKRAVELNPDLAEAYFHLGVALDLMEMQNEQAGIVTNTAPAANSNSKNAAPKKTESEKAFEQAVKAYEKWLKTNPKDDAAHYYLGRTYAKLMKDEEARDAFKEAVELKPDDTEYQTELGAILIKLAQYHEAIKPLKKAIELDQANGRAFDLLEDAEAGRKRVDYVSANKNSNTTAKNSNANTSNSNVGSNSNSASEKPSEKPDPTKPKKPEPETKGKKGDTQDGRPRTVPNKPN